MEVGSVASGMALRFAKPSAGPRLPQPWAKPFRHLQLHHMPSWRRCPSSSLCSAVRAYQRPQPAACEDIETPTDGTREIEALTPSVISSEHKALLALILSLGFAFGSAEVALALGPEGPLVEEFWDNMRSGLHTWKSGFDSPMDLNTVCLSVLLVVLANNSVLKGRHVQHEPFCIRTDAGIASGSQSF
ncbi:hypothetical protein L7F22_014390 [Adiantum nelumboides]|nr:hypothetical protein [Adiantum nelumboides]